MSAKNEISRDVIVNEVEALVQRLVSHQTCNDSPYKERYEALVEEINFIHQQGENLYRSMKEDGLSFGSVEAEGYVRATSTIINTIKGIDENYGNEEA